MERTEAITLTNMCMIYDNQGNVLVEDKVGKNVRGLIFPGGHVEQHESIVDSMIREIYEETGLKIRNIKLCGIKDWIEADGSRYMVFLYKTNCFEGSIISSSEGNVLWMPLIDLRKQPVLWHLHEMLEIFCEHGVSELYCNTLDSGKTPVLK